MINKNKTCVGGKRLPTFSNAVVFLRLTEYLVDWELSRTQEVIILLSLLVLASGCRYLRGFTSAECLTLSPCETVLRYSKNVVH